MLIIKYSSFFTIFSDLHEGEVHRIKLSGCRERCFHIMNLMAIKRIQLIPIIKEDVILDVTSCFCVTALACLMSQRDSKLA